ncbi:MAG TPA: RDD family protein [Lapillicoccus sp.]
MGALLLDYLLILPGWLLAFFGLVLATPSTGSRSRAASGGPSVGVVLALVGYALMLGLTIWNRYIRAGRTGQSWGKKVVGIRLVRESDLRPIGAGMASVRDIAHIVDGFFYQGYLWPLWDPKRQTFADRICSTVILAH